MHLDLSKSTDWELGFHLCPRFMPMAPTSSERVDAKARWKLQNRISTERFAILVIQKAMHKNDPDSLVEHGGEGRGAKVGSQL